MLKSFLTAALIAGASLTAACNNADAPKTMADAVSAPALINPNTVAPAALNNIKMLPADMQAAILKDRPFAGPSDFHALVSKYADADMQAKIYSKVFIPVNANTADAADLMLIPSPLTPKKLAHEIDEYRPYKDMGEFERELGKYMDDAVLAKLKRYVFVE